MMLVASVEISERPANASMAGKRDLRALLIFNSSAKVGLLLQLQTRRRGGESRFSLDLVSSNF